ncbi:hypothetical protein D7X33_10900 [Butyricicoccus sp. 1XD8-22]|nr:hypothetical protein D7X33_10900 [Butyricicoccus sp. 1XD8-22]
MGNAPFFTFALYIAKFFLDLSIVDHRRFCKRFFNIFFFIFRLFPVIGLDGAPDFFQKVQGDFAGGAAQMVKDGGGGELNNARKVLIFQIVAGVQAAASQEGVLDAGGQKVFIAHFQIEVIQFLQKAVPYVIAQVLQVVPVNLAHGAFRLLHERPANVTFLRGSILPFQRLRNSAGFFCRHFPQVGYFRPTNGPGVRYVIDIPQFGLAPRVFCNQGNPRGPGLDPAAHGIVPQLHLRTGGSVRALRVDQQLLIKTVFIEPGGRR